ARPGQDRAPGAHHRQHQHARSQQRPRAVDRRPGAELRGPLPAIAGAPGGGGALSRPQGRGAAAQPGQGPGARPRGADRGRPGRAVLPESPVTGTRPAARRASRPRSVLCMGAPPMDAPRRFPRRKRMRKWIGLVLLAGLAGCGGSVLPQVHDEEGRLDLARRLYNKGDAALAIEALAPFTTTGSGSANVDQAVYLLGLCHLRQKDFPTAQGDFERVLRDYPESDSAASAAFRLGEALWGQSRGPDFDQEFTLRALDQWMSFRRDHADHWLAPAATRRIAEARTRLATKLYRTGDLYVKLREVEAARSHFPDVMREDAETPLYGDAMIGWAVASARLGERDTAMVLLQNIQKEYDGAPLGDRAEKVMKDMKHWKWGTSRYRRHTAPNEPPPPSA